MIIVSFFSSFFASNKSKKDQPIKKVGPFSYYFGSVVVSGFASQLSIPFNPLIELE